MRGIDVDPHLPKHFHETHSSPLRGECAQGEIKELQDCMNRDVWLAPVNVSDIRATDPIMILIGLMWVYTVKSTDAGLFSRIRSRITLLGNQMRSHLDKLEAYAPVAQIVTLRILIVTHMHIPGIKFRGLDVSNAYINQKMKRKVYCKFPPGYHVWSQANRLRFRRLEPGEKHDPNVCLPVQMALYGGMECGRIFWEAWVDWHLADGFQLIHEERCYLHKRAHNGDFIKLAYHVDDNAIVALGDKFYDDYLIRLKTNFDVTEGPLVKHLGMHYDFDLPNGIVRITQPDQIQKILKTFGFEHCKPAETPMRSGPEPSMADAAIQYDGDWDMYVFLGHCNYIHVCSRPDIGKVLKTLSRAPVKFGDAHVLFAKHLLRYLKGTVNMGLTFRSGYPLYMQVFTDASHANCVDTRRSTTSVVIKYGGNTILW